jgi:hypothetical protein
MVVVHSQPAILGISTYLALTLLTNEKGVVLLNGDPILPPQSGTTH